MALRFVAVIAATALFACSAVGPRNNHRELYVVNAGNSTVSVFDLADAGAARRPIVRGTLYGPSGPDGKLYVANSSSDSVSVFDTLHANARLTPLRAVVCTGHTV